MTLEAEYKGSTTIDGVMWTVTGGVSGMLVIVPQCSPFSIPSGFPYGRMSHDCSFAPKYRLTIQTLDSADFHKTWEVDFSLLTGSTASGRQQQTVTQCETDWLNEECIPRANKLFRPMPDPPDEEHTRMPATNEAKKDNGKEIRSKPPDKSYWRFMRKAANKLFPHKLFQRESDNKSAMEFDEENHNEEISNGYVLHEERLTNEAIKYYIRPMNEIDLLNEERRHLTNEANENIQQRNEIKPPDEPNTRITRLEVKEAKEDIRPESDNRNVSNGSTV